MDSHRSQHIADPLADAARRHPERPALIHPNGAITYRALDHIVRRTTAALEARPDRIALCMEPTWQYCALLLAIWRAGRVACPLSTRAPSAGLARQLGAIDAGLLITTRRREGSLEGYDLIEPAALLGESRRKGPARGANRTEASERDSAEPSEAIRTEAKADEPGDDRIATWDLDAPATLLFTSGSTSEPHAALHSLGNHVWNARGAQHAIALGEGDRWCLSLPLYHVGGLAILFRCMLSGAAVVLPSEEAPLHTTLVKHRITHLSIVPTQLERLLGEPGADGGPDNTVNSQPDYGSLKAALLGGGPIPHELVAAALQRGIPLHTTYGLTEMASQVASTTADDRAEGAARLKTAGRVLPHRELRIDASGRSRQGEIQVRGATLFQGYVIDGALKRPLTPGGWFATGDVGRMDEEGYLHVIGRMDNLFVSGGENIHPEEIEQALLALTGVVRAAVVAVPDPTYGARPVAFVHIRSEGSPESDPENRQKSHRASRRESRRANRPQDFADTLRAELSEILPKYKIPDAFFPWSRIPEEAFTGGLQKVRRSTLAQHARAMMGTEGMDARHDD